MFVGKVTNYFGKIGVAEITLETNSLEIGEEILILGSTTGVYEAKLTEIRVDLKPVQKTIKGEVCSFSTSELVRRGDKVYKWVAADKNVPNLVQ